MLRQDKLVIQVNSANRKHKPVIEWQWARCLSCRPSNSVKALKATVLTAGNNLNN